MATEIAAGPSETPTSAPTAAPIETPTLTPTVAPSNTPTATATPSLTPTATATSTPTPTATPDGYYRNEAGGYALIIPNGWGIVGEEDDLLQLVNRADNLVLIIDNVSELGAIPFDELVDEVVQALGAEALTLASQDEISVGSGVTADRAILLDDSGANPALHIIYVQNTPHNLLMIVIGSPAVLDQPDSSISDVYANMSFLPLSLFGLPLDQTLLEIGSDPLPESLDPATQSNSAAQYIGLLYSGLVRLTPQLGIEPDLAESWAISPDGLTYTFTLRPDLAFADGTPLTAADVKYSWERATDPDLESETAETYLGDIAGVKEKIAGEADEISGVVVVDERTLTVTLDAPKPYFLAKLAYPTSYVVDQADVESGDDDWMFAANASGPYQIREYRAGEALIVERNENYHTPAQIPYVIYRFNLFGNALSLYEGGQIDFVGVGGDDLLDIQQPDHPLHDQLLSTTSLCTSIVQLNNNRAPLDDINVRQALALATDKQLLIDRFGSGVSLLAQTLLPPGMPGYSLDGTDWSYNPDAARELLANSSYGNDLPPITLSTFGRGNAEDEYLLALATMWQEELGIEYTIEYFDPVDYTTAAQALDSHVITWGWCADYPDPENFLDLLFHSESNFNLAEYSNPELDALLEQARVELDSATRLALYHEIELMLLADVGVIPVSHGVSHRLVSPRVQGYVLAAMGIAQTHRLSLSPE
ncbi:MAG: hypothetical protein H6651_22090 [Ardenticatenales bacterium]|nr:hypothetical protein [Ardenticatenales bacterium]